MHCQSRIKHRGETAERRALDFQTIIIPIPALKGKLNLEELLETVFLSFAYGAYFRRPVSSAQIAADFASPDRQRKGIKASIYR